MKKIILFLFCVLNFFALEAKKYTYELAIGAIFRDEAPYLKEWIEFHKIVGVEHFYLYNNVSQDDYLSVLQPYIDSGEVELFDWPYEDNSFKGFCYHVQPQAYSDCIRRADGVADWLAIIDTDEFLTPTRKNTVPEVLKSYQNYAGVCFDWQVFGTSDIPAIPEDKLMIETLVMRAASEHPKNKFYKSIVRPEYVIGCNNPHFVLYKPYCYAVDADKVPIKSSKSAKNRPHLFPLVINHYWTRAEDHCFGSKYQQYKQWDERFSLEIFKTGLDTLNEVRDYTMARFIPLLRIKMGFDPAN